MPDNLPSRRISREALERVIQRAAELQAGELDTGEAMTEQELLQLGADVGIDGRFLRQALYEERAAAPSEERGLVARWIGPGHVRASRVIQDDRATVEQALEHWMADKELLSVKRRLPDRTVWERQKGFVAEMKRGFGVGGREYRLAKAKEITVSVTPLETGYCHVDLSADITVSRAGVLGGSFAIAAVGAAGAIVTATVGAPVAVPVLAGVVFGVGAIAVSAAHRPVVERTQLALEQVLDRLERGEIKPRHQVEPESLFPFGRIANEIRRAITDAADGPRRGSRRLNP